MHQQIEAAPFFLERREHRRDLRVVVDVELADHVRLDLLRQRPHALFEDLALVGQRDLGAFRCQRLRDRPRQALVVRDADDQRALAFYYAHGSSLSATVRARLRSYILIFMPS